MQVVRFTQKKAENENIDAKTSPHLVIVPSNLDYAVKKSLADCKLADDVAWTDEEKASARTLINAQAKIPNANGGVASARFFANGENINMNIYSRGADTTEKLLCGSVNGWGLIENSQITRTQLEKQLGDYDEEKASLQSQIDNKVAIVTDADRVYCTNNKGEQIVRQWALGGVANTFVMRDDKGNIYSTTPRFDSHVTTKAYVDGLIAQLREELGLTTE